MSASQHIDLICNNASQNNLTSPDACLGAFEQATTTGDFIDFIKTFFPEGSTTFSHIERSLKDYRNYGRTVRNCSEDKDCLTNSNITYTFAVRDNPTFSLTFHFDDDRLKKVYVRD